MSPSPSAQRPTAISVLIAHAETEPRKRDGLGTLQESPGERKRWKITE